MAVNATQKHVVAMERLIMWCFFTIIFLQIPITVVIHSAIGAGGKSPATNGKSKENNTKSGSQVSCKSCSKFVTMLKPFSLSPISMPMRFTFFLFFFRTFNSENAQQSHAKAKHGDK